MAKQLEKKHSPAVRWLHWISFPLLTLMIWSGILIYWANAIYGVRAAAINRLAKNFRPTPAVSHPSGNLIGECLAVSLLELTRTESIRRLPLFGVIKFVWIIPKLPVSAN